MTSRLIHRIYIFIATVSFSVVACSAEFPAIGNTGNTGNDTDETENPGNNDDSGNTGDTGNSGNVYEELMKLPYREIVDRHYKGRFYLGIANHAKLIGQLSTEIADREFGYITPANDFKQSYIHPTFNSWRWDKPDQYLAHAKKQGQVLRMHGPVSPQCSKWAREDNRTPEELSKMMEEFLVALCMHYNSDKNILWMDVVNETIAKENTTDAIFGDVTRGGWFGPREGIEKWENPWPIIGYDESSEIRPPLYIDKAFEICNQHAPDIKQIINQHGNFEEEVWDKMKKLVEYLRAKGRRVDGLGWQAHIDTGWEKEPGNLERLDNFITWCHQNNLEFHITEMNVWIKDQDVTREAEQAETFAAVIDTVLKHSDEGVTGVSFWNVRDEDTSNPTWMGTIWRNDGTPRPAYERIKQVLAAKAQSN